MSVVQTPKELFLKKIKKTENCWLWEGSHNKNNYGVFICRQLNPYRILAHRFSFMLFKGLIPKGMWMDPM
jgi:hypothetical protein